MASFSYLQPEAKLRYYYEPESGSYRELPILSYRVSYRLNEIPTATVTVPYGYRSDIIISGGTAVGLPTLGRRYFVELLAREHGNADWLVIFTGWISFIGEATTGEGRVISISLIHRLDALRQQPATVQPVEVHYEDNYPQLALIWDGIGTDPWNLKDGRLNLGAADALISKLADGTIGFQEAVLATLLLICYTQYNYPDLSASQSGARLASDVLDDMNWPTGSEQINYPDPYGAISTSIYSLTDDFIPAFSLNFRESIAAGVGRILCSSSGTLWDVLRAFCDAALYYICPWPAAGCLLPLVFPPHPIHANQPAVEYDSSDIISLSVGAWLETLPLRAVYMLTQAEPGPWNLGPQGGIYILGRSTLSWLETDPFGSGGKFEIVRTPGLFDPSQAMGSEVELPANRYCFQHLLNGTYGRRQITLRLPGLSQNRFPAIGALTKFSHDVSGEPGALKYGTYYGVAVGLDLIMDRDSGCVADLYLSYIMDTGTIDDLGATHHFISSRLYYTTQNEISYTPYKFALPKDGEFTWS